MNYLSSLLTFAFAITGIPISSAAESLPPLADGKAPQTFKELWAAYDPRAEPLDVELLREWEEEGVVMRVIRYRIGIFKGQKAMMAAVYGFPKGGSKLPGLVNIHGGGQYADSNAVFTNAKRGYATITIAWAGRISAPDYRVSPDGVKLFWEGKTDHPQYRITTDWGALDAYHAPSRKPKNAFPAIPAPAPWTLDQVPSPRNNGWFLCALGARRALTFLEQQPEVDGEKLGVYGHSMGGKLTVMTVGSDYRVRAAAPSCGGMSDRYNRDPLFRPTLGDDAYLRNIQCPIIFLSPSNDFHGRINDLQTAVTEIQSQDWRVTCSPHHNHQDTAEFEVATQLWFDQHLKGSFTCPKTPGTELKLNTENGIPLFTVRPDESKPVLAVDVYHTRQGQLQKIGDRPDLENAKSRFWHHAAATKKDGAWTAELPLLGLDDPLWVYANVRYPLDQPVSGAGYYFRTYTTNEFTISSPMAMVTPDELEDSGVKATLSPSLTIESFSDGWEKEWFSYKPETWPRKTHKLYDPRWAAPVNAKLAFEVHSPEPNEMVVGIDQSAAEVKLEGRSDWQEIVLSPDQFMTIDGKSLTDWTGLKELRLGDQETLRPGRGSDEKPLKLGAAWRGPNPKFRNLRWIEDR